MLKSLPALSVDHEELGTLSNKKLVRVLVIDDDPSDFYAVDRMIRQSNDHRYELVHIDNFDEGCSALKHGDYAVALIDYHLGNRFGVEILSAIEGHLDLPVVMLTGSNDRAVEAAALKAGAFDFIDKNAMTSATLVRSLEFAINRFAIEQQIRENQERLKRDCENAEAAHFSKSEFLEFLGNELRTPLNAILGFSRVMKEDSLSAGMPEVYQTYSKTIHESGSQLSKLIDDLLDLSKTDAASYDARNRRFKRYRTWIVDRHEAAKSIKVLRKNAG